jgi:hypothetical protein
MVIIPTKGVEGELNELNEKNEQHARLMEVWLNPATLNESKSLGGEA